MICLVAMPTMGPPPLLVALVPYALCPGCHGSAQSGLCHRCSLCISCCLSLALALSLPPCVLLSVYVRVCVCVCGYKCILKLHLIRVIYFVYSFVLLALCWHSLISFAAREHNNSNNNESNNNDIDNKTAATATTTTTKRREWNILLLRCWCIEFELAAVALPAHCPC